MKDTHTLLLTMSEINPFAESTSLRNMLTGVNATGDVDLCRFELCSYPSALFEDTLMPRAPEKAVLANAANTVFPPDIAGPTGEVQHVLDGGALLHLHILLVCHKAHLD